MRIGIIGVGHLGGALAKVWAGKGHDILLGVRDTKKSHKYAKLLSLSKKINLTTVYNAAQMSEVILLATPAHQARSVAKQVGRIHTKVVIDATNAVMFKPKPYAHATAALKALTDCTHIVKCFNTTGHENLQNPKYGRDKLDMFMAGDSEYAKKIARQLALDAGFGECHDFGGDAQIPLLEQFGMVWINLAIVQKQGANIGFKVLKRKDYHK